MSASFQNLASKRKRLNRFAFAIIFLQILCAGFFLVDITIELLHLRSTPQSWTAHEFMEVAAVLGSLFGILCAYLVWMLLKQRIDEMEKLTNFLSGNFSHYIEEEFRRWALSDSEESVAWGVMKGYSNKEIAEMRGTSEGTVKAQTAAVFKKAGVNNRQQFISNFIEDLIARNAGQNTELRE